MDRIDAYLDEVFGKFYESNALRDLKEEIRMNAQDRFNECMEEGRSEAEAEQVVLSAMGDLEGMLEENGAVRAGSTSQNFEGSMKGFAESMQGLSEMFSKMFHSQKSEDGHLEEAYANIERIRINGTELDVDIKPSDSEQVMLKADGDIERLYMNPQENGELIIQENNADSMFSNGVRIFLEVPYLKQISISLVSGDIAMCDADAEKVDMQTVSGDARISLGDAAHLQYVSTSGDLSLKAERIDDLKIRTISGDIRINAAAIHDGEIHSTSGDVTVKTEEALHTETKTVSGDVHLGRKNTQTSDQLRVHTVSGDISVR